MTKNLIIVIQALMIISGTFFFVVYKRVIEQTHIVGGLGFIATETKFVHKMYQRLENGECNKVIDIMRETERSNISQMLELTSEFNFYYSSEKTIRDAKEYAAMLNEVGLYTVSELIEERAKKIEQSKY